MLQNGYTHFKNFVDSRFVKKIDEMKKIYETFTKKTLWDLLFTISIFKLMPVSRHCRCTAIF